MSLEHSPFRDVPSCGAFYPIPDFCRELAKRLGLAKPISRSTHDAWVASGKLAAPVKFGGRCLHPVERVDEIAARLRDAGKAREIA
jgi:hypothetical protein